MAAVAVTLAGASMVAVLTATAPTQGTPADILITGGTIVTMNPTREIIEDGAVAIAGNRIVAVGPTAELRGKYRAAQVIDAKRKIIMPGLIDGHGHAGHGLLKTLGTDVNEWNNAAEKMYARGSTPEFWAAEGQLSALERMQFGVTTSVTLFGGGNDVYRTDDPRYGEAYLNAVKQVGVRWLLAVGPGRGPFPTTFTDWTGGSPRDAQVTFARQMEVSEGLIKKWNNTENGRMKMAVVFPTSNPTENLAGAALAERKAQAKEARELARKYGVFFIQDGHTKGTVKFAHEQLNLLGPDAIFSHATDLTEEEIKLIAQTGTRISHNPSAIFSIRGRNPTTELIDAGAIVMLGSDGSAPDRSYDMFRHMFQATRYHRFYFRDPNVLPAGKVLEMATIDGARALGMEKEIGSLEVGKKADVILVDWFKPHMVPMNMPVYRLVYFAEGTDVATVIVDGKVLMRDRKVLTVNTEQVLTRAQEQADLAIKRSGLENLTAMPPGFWGKTRLGK
jgi:5-methylthioadenosine/S-adenosylhomocysteine deaminase